MSRKDYENIAFVLGVEKASKRMIKHFCNMLHRDSSDFDENRFTNAVKAYRAGVIYR